MHKGISLISGKCIGLFRVSVTKLEHIYKAKGVGLNVENILYLPFHF